MTKIASYTITDEDALFKSYPNLFKSAPNHKRIKMALAAGFTLPGVELKATPIEEALGGVTEQPVKRL